MTNPIFVNFMQIVQKMHFNNVSYLIYGIKLEKKKECLQLRNSQFSFKEMTLVAEKFIAILCNVKRKYIAFVYYVLAIRCLGSMCHLKCFACRRLPTIALEATKLLLISFYERLINEFSR
jgi:hypothetical protein